MHRFSASVLISLAIVAGAAPLARAQGQIPDAITVGSLTLTANFNTIQVSLNYTGDGNADADVKIRYWRTSQGSSYADTAVMLQDDTPAHHKTGTIFWLDD